MDQNEIINQLASNPQMLAQILQTMQQNGMIPQNQPPQRPPMNWNMPTTNPMAGPWWNNMSNMNNPNNQVQQQNVPNNNQVQQPNTQNIQTEQKLDDDILSISIVKSPDDIRIDQIPMSDKISLFMQDDMSVIYGKRWTNNGTIDDLRYILEKQPGQGNTNPSDNTAVNNQSFNIEELMTAVGNIVNTKLEEFKKDYLDDNNNYNQSKNNKNNNERGNRNGK